MGVIIDKTAPQSVFTLLRDMNVNYIKSASIDHLYKPVNTHPDMQIHFINKTTAVSAPLVYEYYRKMLPQSIDLIKGDAEPGIAYPWDCAYNVVAIGKRLFGNLKYVDKKILNIYKALGFEFVNVKQGYTKCNLCVVDDNSAITEDDGLFRALTGCGINVLKVEAGNVSLNGFDNGFIGGASGFLDDKRICFFGDLKTHTNYNEIKNFIEAREINIICLLSTKLQDYGSILNFE